MGETEQQMSTVSTGMDGTTHRKIKLELTNNWVDVTIKYAYKSMEPYG